MKIKDLFKKPKENNEKVFTFNMVYGEYCGIEGYNTEGSIFLEGITFEAIRYIEHGIILSWKDKDILVPESIPDGKYNICMKCVSVPGTNNLYLALSSEINGKIYQYEDIRWNK